MNDVFARRSALKPPKSADIHLFNSVTFSGAQLNLIGDDYPPLTTFSVLSVKTFVARAHKRQCLCPYTSREAQASAKRTNCAQV
jgi:hypothetical protein